MSKPDSWMPLYIGDYLADTGHLTAQEHGAYLLLLMAAWTRNGQLPNDDTLLRRMSRVDHRRWTAVKTILEPFFEVTPEHWVSPRLRQELLHSEARYARIVERAKNAANQRWADAASNAQAMLDAREPQPQRATTTTKSKTTTHPRTNGNGHDHPYGRGTRLPDDFRMPEDWIDYGQQVQPNWSRQGVYRESITFRDFWHAKAGANARKVDWLKTWRNWIRGKDKEPQR